MKLYQSGGGEIQIQQVFDIAKIFTMCVLERRCPGLSKSGIHIWHFIIWYVCGSALKISKQNTILSRSQVQGLFWTSLSANKK